MPSATAHAITRAPITIPITTPTIRPVTGNEIMPSSVEDVLLAVSSFPSAS